MVRLLPFPGFALPPIAGSQVGLAADDGFDPGFTRRGIELDRTEHVAVIGDRNGWHVELLRPSDQGVDSRRPVEQAVMRVNVEMNERRLGHRRTGLPSFANAVERTTLVLHRAPIDRRSEPRP